MFKKNEAVAEHK